MATLLDIWNSALGRVGHTFSIESPAERSEEARICREYWELARRETISAFDWPFAVRTEPTLELTGVDIPPPWCVMYALPADCLRLSALFNFDPLYEVPVRGQGVRFGGGDGDYWRRGGRGFLVEFERYGYTDANGDDRESIVASVPSAYVRYLKDVETPEHFTSDFTNAVIWRLGADIAVVTSRAREWRQDCMAAFDMAVRKAKTLAQRERKRAMPESRLIRARY